MFYQSQNSLYSDLIKIETGNDFNFPPHLHSSFEFITVSNGEMTVTVDKKQYELKAGESILIFPNQLHSFSTKEHSSHLLCIFATKLVQGYSNIFLSKRPIDHRFFPDRFYIDKLYNTEILKDSLKAKGVLYSLCAEFDSNAVYEDKSNEKEDLLLKIFQFVEQNYNRSCSLEALSEHISYHSVYLSRYFKQCTGLTYTDYVNRYRVNEAGYILKNSDSTILRIAYECGFDSLRSFNRNFKKIMGMTPVEFKNNN